ncbi:cob(I)yrinic acid a,c-diamide adenosyltransferase [Desulfofundulus thermosubterraneus]|uniref:Cob(I)alamin adenosyltransferase n=1 Tax=Desulfofundulus thermosubterraneus DSM 16057 TaxID=1121432 RepID=A0A1M6HV51_9FIRM|nr:cob(I)yrinic acid a,c-diamide adenosyltransferase [Desulfofundulus thermosubterraneus]SHJ26122.1 cob(I)alamin adenosyltransferase [Desulfofundulus thermosubterraneus DSM 16057]
MSETNGLILVFTGNGKGKTTAALGMGLRAWGQGMKVLVLQFIKGGWRYGELNAPARLGDRFEIRQRGEGFTRVDNGKTLEDHREAARHALEEANKEITAGNFDLIILDEILYALKFGLITREEVLALLDKKPPRLHIALTGRDAPPEIIDRADLVTEMKEIKHHYKKGIKAQRGIEF